MTSNRTRIAVRRVAAAYDVLRGRPPKPDYGILVVLPFLAAAGGSLFALAAETLIEGRRSRRPRSEAGSPAAGRPGALVRSIVDTPTSAP